MKIMREVVTERRGDTITASYLVEVTEQEIQQAKLNYAETGECDHQFITDKDCWICVARGCAICGAGLGAL